jgi:hypothetical protein
VIAVTEIKRLAEGGEIVMRQAAMRILSGGAFMHAVPNVQDAALCGFVPASGWLDDIDDQAARVRTCRACHFQLQRAGYSVSFSGRITRVEQAS